MDEGIKLDKLPGMDIFNLESYIEFLFIYYDVTVLQINKCFYKFVVIQIIMLYLFFY